MCINKKLITFIISLHFLASCESLNRTILVDEVIEIKKNTPVKENLASEEKIISKEKMNTKVIIDQKNKTKAIHLIESDDALKMAHAHKINNTKNNKRELRKILRQKSTTNTKVVLDYCKKINKKFLKMGWGKSYCEHFDWMHVRDSVLGTPLLWKVYGNEKLHKSSKFDTTLVFCGVHGDEITPPKFCFDVLYHMESIMAGHHHGKDDLKNKLVVIAPIVNPDSFFKRWPTRTNARKVDINRNFPTRDWNRLALKTWKNRYRSDKRRFPGKKSLSEPEVLFQMNLIRRYKPSKIISVHAPLTILDYDGPDIKGSKNKFNHVAHNANQLLIQMSKQAKGYRIKNYPFFPGSLGNWAGNERQIPTYTLELPTSDNRQSKKFWKLFKSSIHSAIIHDFKVKNKIATKTESKSVNVN